MSCCLVRVKSGRMAVAPDTVVSTNERLEVRECSWEWSA